MDLLQSEVGHGTRVSILLPPVSNALAASYPAAPHEEGPMASGTETVLQVEDEPRLRSLLFEVLRRAGYEVLEAANGLEAARLVSDSALHLDLLLTDLVMPGLGGRELAQRLQEQRPGLRVLFMSGYAEAEGGYFLGDLGEEYLQKPFEPSTLTSRVRAILDQTVTVLS